MATKRKNARGQGARPKARKRPGARRAVHEAVTGYARVTVLPKVTGSGPMVVTGTSVDLEIVNALVESAYRLAATPLEDGKWQHALADLCANAVHFGVDTLVKEGRLSLRTVRSRPARRGLPS